MKSNNSQGIVLPTVLVSLLVLVATLITVIGYSQRGLEFVVRRGFNDRAQRAAVSGVQYVNYLVSNRYSNLSVSDCPATATSLGTTQTLNDGAIKSEFTVDAIGPRANPVTNKTVKCPIKVTGKAYRSVDATVPYATHTIDAVLEKGSFKYADAFAGNAGIIFKPSNQVSGNLYTSGVLQFYNGVFWSDDGIKNFTVAGTTPLPSADYVLQGPGSLDRCSVDFRHNETAFYNSASSTFKTKGAICRKKDWGASAIPQSYLEPHYPDNPNIPIYRMPQINRYFVIQKAHDGGNRACSTLYSLANNATIPPGYYFENPPIAGPSPDSCNNVSLTSGRNYTVNGANGPIYINGTLNLNNNQITNSSATNPMIIYVRGQISVVGNTRFGGGPIIFVADGREPNTFFGWQRDGINLRQNNELRSNTALPPNVAFMSPYSTINIEPAGGNSQYGPIVARKIRIYAPGPRVQFNTSAFTNINDSIPFAWKVTEQHRSY
ncbi:hypothetical protein KBC31_03775 [Candidatus Saccharibacteria bacterium]|jgi:Tfp pilus assembly protein PilX|nr:hypothetical protein [Candidatus Saccharibacteria bacterium]